MRFLLLDTNVIIHAHELEIWQELTKRSEITVAGTVLRDESLYYYRPDTGAKVYLNLEDDLRAGRIRELTVPADSPRELSATLPRTIKLDAGELESLAGLARATEPYHFCTGDAPAVRVLVLLGRAEQGISMEKMLEKSGLRHKLDAQFTEARFREYVRHARAECAQTVKLRPQPK